MEVMDTVHLLLGRRVDMHGSDGHCSFVTRETCGYAWK